MGDGDRDWAKGVSRECWEAGDESHEEMGAFGRRLWGSGLIDKVGRGRGRRWVNNAVVGVALDGFAIVVEATAVGVMGEEFSEEVVFGGGDVAARANFTTTSGGFWVLDAAAEAAAEGAGEFALVFRVGKWVNWEIGVRGRGFVGLEDGFGRAEEGRGRRQRAGWEWRKSGGSGHRIGRQCCDSSGKSGSRSAAKFVDGSEFVVDFLGCSGNAAEFRHLAGEGGKATVVSEG